MRSVNFVFVCATDFNSLFDSLSASRNKSSALFNLSPRITNGSSRVPSPKTNQ